MFLRALLLLCCSTFLTFAQAQLLPGFVQEQIAQGLDPTTMAIAPDGRVFIAEKNGRIRIVEDGLLLSAPFTEIEVDNFNERGLSGLAFHPDFETNHYLYVFYTVPGGNYNRISRFTANGNAALPGSETILMEFPPLSGSIHNGGAMVFGPDGKLYVAVGDGADPETGQNLNTTLGKILRLNPDGSIPDDNPFYEQLSGQQRSIYAYGFRNPFTMAVDPATGTIHANDVGSNLFEEVNQIEAGGNYGWALKEGPGDAPFPPDYRAPLHSYTHDVGCSVIGAAFYRPAQLQFPPEYLGKYFFADYCEGIIWTMPADGSEAPEEFATDIERPIAMATAPDGSLYYLERRGLGGGSPTDNTSSSNGVLWKVSYTGSGAPFVSSQPQSQLRVVGETAEFSCSVSGAGTLNYQWQRNGTDLPGATASTLSYPDVSLADDGSTFRCQISNAEGSILTEEAVLSVTANTRPVPAITLPEPGTTYEAGNTISFAGYADDQENGALPAGQLNWRIDFHHDDHTHPGMPAQTGLEEGVFQIPVIGETSTNVWYRIHLTATDDEGLSNTVFRDVYPELRNINLATEPAGLQLRLDGRSVGSPAEEQGVVGVIRSLRAPASQVKDGVLYGFSHWESGVEEPLITFAMPDTNISFKAIYEEVLVGQGKGLTGYYYNESVPDFTIAPAFSRVDTTVSFNWEGGSPDAAQLGTDFFNIRWLGSVQPQFSELYTFHVVSDDGLRLWVDGELIIDQWVPQPPTETTGSLFMEAGERYDIRLEYFEEAGGAVCELYWSSPRTERSIIPKSQLYPDDFTAADASPLFDELVLYPVPADEELSVLLRGKAAEQLEVRLTDSRGALVWKGLIWHDGNISLHRIPTAAFPAGFYQLQFRNARGQHARPVILK